MRLLGLDPGLRRTGWGVIVVEGSRLSHLGNGVIETADDEPIARRLAALHDGLAALIEDYRPDEAAVEATFVNRNASSTLKLGMARGVVMLAPARLGVPVAEYAPNLVKKSIVGTGHAEKGQVERMVRVLLPGCAIAGADAADALAIAICHAHHRASRARISARVAEVEERP
ncbi:MAG: crossover junction endodeoxyribonuclease RuvC [Alphaproteobacteria bacterium]